MGTFQMPSHTRNLAADVGPFLAKKTANATHIKGKIQDQRDIY
jgi:hypothetical protein